MRHSTLALHLTAPVTVELVAAGTGYADNQTLTIADNQLGGGGAPDITLDINGVTDASDIYILPITTPAATDFDIGDLILLDRGNAVHLLMKFPQVVELQLLV